MRELKVNPQNYEFHFYADTIEKGEDLAKVYGEFFGDEGHAYVTEKEAASIGKWFTELSKEIALKNKEYA